MPLVEFSHKHKLFQIVLNPISWLAAPLILLLILLNNTLILALSCLLGRAYSYLEV